MYSEVHFPWIDEECYYIQRVKHEKNHISPINGNDSSKNKETLSSKKIAVLIIKNKFAKNNIILSHGNSSSLGTTYSLLIDMSTQLKVLYI